MLKQHKEKTTAVTLQREYEGFK